ncbi:BrnT family toxin [Methylocystis suflitae]|uniref:BrnT family toxin n=1 Tax=Methylocystis suflitae TaxID=2951405 RepID=UPI00210D31ED|nr:BrnT family toxin [Methylocystis suflitae]MCQ4189385.1 BrnT family toxin [Methylocystis suflitae]
MVNFEHVVGFEWDHGNARKSVEKHDVSQAEAEQIFANDPLIVTDDLAHDDLAHNESEPRYHALGRTDASRLLHVTFTLRSNGTRIRVISARDMSRKERQRYEQDD